jgi:hypothetical protein
MEVERRPKFLEPEQVYGLLGAGARGDPECSWVVPTGERCRGMLWRVLARVPVGDLVKLFRRAVFIMSEGAGVAYLSTKLLHGRHVVLLGEGLLGLTEDEQAEAILPRAADALLSTPHPLEPVREETDWSQIMDESEEGDGWVNQRAFDREMRLIDDAIADLKIGAHFAGQRAAELAGGMAGVRPADGLKPQAWHTNATAAVCPRGAAGRGGVCWST